MKTSVCSICCFANPGLLIHLAITPIHPVNKHLLTCVMGHDTLSVDFIWSSLQSILQIGEPRPREDKSHIRKLQSQTSDSALTDPQSPRTFCFPRAASYSKDEWDKFPPSSGLINFSLFGKDACGRNLNVLGVTAAKQTVITTDIWYSRWGANVVAQQSGEGWGLKVASALIKKITFRFEIFQHTDKHCR